MSHSIRINTINILGVNISALSKNETLKKIEEFLLEKKQRYITTPNPEIILASLQDEEYKHILNSADISISDGIGIKFAAWTLGLNITKITGSDLTKWLLRSSEKRKLRIGIVNWGGGLSNMSDIKRALLKNHPALNFAIDDIEKDDTYEKCKNVLKLDPDILFVSLGAPYQEKFIFNNLSKFKNTKIAIGVGGSFDFLTKKATRAPKLMRSLGFEWLWRLIKKPTRIKRIFNAVVVFPVKFMTWRYFKK